MSSMVTPWPSKCDGLQDEANLIAMTPVVLRSTIMWFVCATEIMTEAYGVRCSNTEVMVGGWLRKIKSREAHTMKVEARMECKAYEYSCLREQRRSSDASQRGKVKECAGC